MEPEVDISSGKKVVESSMHVFQMVLFNQREAK